MLAPSITRGLDKGGQCGSTTPVEGGVFSCQSVTATHLEPSCEMLMPGKSCRRARRLEPGRNQATKLLTVMNMTYFTLLTACMSCLSALPPRGAAKVCMERGSGGGGWHRVAAKCLRGRWSLS